MSSLHELLDRFGRPPASICLDWAWQILEWAQHSGEPVTSVAGEKKLFSWADIHIQSNGQLVFQDPCNGWEAISLVDELLDWSGAPKERLIHFSNLQDRRQILDELTFDLLHQQAVARETQISSEPVPQELSTSLKIDSAQSHKVEPTNRIKKSQRRHSKSRFPIRTLQFAGGLVTLVTAAVVVWMMLPMSDSKQGSATLAGNSTVSDAQVQIDNQGAVIDGLASSTIEIDRLLNPSAINEHHIIDSTDSESVIQLSRLEEIDSSPISRPNNKPVEGSSVAGTLANASGGLSALGAPNLVLSKSTDQPSDADRSSSAPESPNAELDTRASMALGDAKAQDAKQQDVASIVASMNSDEPKIHSTSSDPNSTATLPVQLLDIDTVLQVEEFPGVRVREPRWELSLGTTSAFAVDPSTPQILSEKQVIRWILIPKDFKPRKDQQPTRIVVMAQLAGRRADIKWKIAAVCEDLPTLTIPLNDEKLDRMLSALQNYQQQLAAGIEVVKAQADGRGVSRDQRSLLSKNRKAMEDETKLVARVRQMIADAGLFAGWMDRTLEVHGILFETVGNQTVQLLQIGQPESLRDASETPAAKQD